MYSLVLRRGRGDECGLLRGRTRDHGREERQDETHYVARLPQYAGLVYSTRRAQGDQPGGGARRRRRERRELERGAPVDYC